MELTKLKKSKIIVEDFDRILACVIKSNAIRHTAASLCAIYHIENSDLDNKEKTLIEINDKIYDFPKKKKTNFNKEREIKRILIACAEEFGVTVESLISKSRKRHLVAARQMAMKLIRYNFKYPLSVKEIGKVFHRDHTTVIHSTATIMDYLAVKDSFLYEAHTNILNKLRR